MMPYSSNEGDFRALAASEIRNVLCEIANLQDDVVVGARLMTKLPDDSMSLIGRLSPEIINAERRARGNPPVPEEMEGAVAARIADFQKFYHEEFLLPLRDKLRKIWTEQDLTAKRWAVLDIAQHYYSRLPSKDSVDRLTPTPMAQVLEYLLRSNVHTAICANPQCSNPYFFQPRRGQKYCAENCADPAQREFKRRWWAAHGNAWRKARKQQRIRRKRKP